MTLLFASAAMSQPPPETTAAPRFNSAPSPASLEQLKRDYKPEQLALLEKLNRADIAHLWRLPNLIVPDRWDLDELDYSRLPRTYEAAASQPKAIVVDLSSQVFAAYEYGKLVRWGPVSSGRLNNRTPKGLYHLNWRSKGRRSTDNSDWYLPWYFNFHNKRGLSFHQFDLPGEAASHACLRLLARDAEWIYGWGEEWELSENGREITRYGTPLLITGEYDFKKPPVWRSPEWWNAKIDLPGNPGW